MDKKPNIIFTGTYCHSIDEKNRLFLPAKLRRGISKFIVTPGLDKCLYVYPLNIWVKLIDKFDNLELKDKSKERVFKRLFLSKAAEVRIDIQGRVIIPQALIEQLEIGRDVAIIGVWNRIEIWPQERWKVYSRKAEKVFSGIASKLEI